MNTIDEAIEAFARGEMVIVVDDDDRENEGDLIMAASLATTENMAFMIRHCCGIVCAPITTQIAKRFRLDPMVSANDAPLGTAFTVSVDYRHGLTTGISADERTGTVRALANSNANFDDLVRPGHVFPLIAKDGGVLVRSGHTEAAVDLAGLAGLPEAAVICELVNDDGSVKRLPELQEFARTHGLVLVSIADLIEYRQRREQWSRLSPAMRRKPSADLRKPLFIQPLSIMFNIWRWYLAISRMAGMSLPVSTGSSRCRTCLAPTPESSMTGS